MKLIIVSSVIIAFIAISWSFFTHYWIYIPGIIFNLRTPVLKNQFVTWSASSSSSSSSSGTDTSDPLKRDPNIILILLDDIGYNGIYSLLFYSLLFYSLLLFYSSIFKLFIK